MILFQENYQRSPLPISVNVDGEDGKKLDSTKSCKLEKT